MTETFANLALYLDAPLQSWGFQSKFDRRTSLGQPTRSGIIGMFCAAMGIERQDYKALTQFAQLALTTLIFQQNGILSDFHTVGGGWSKATEVNHIVPTALGKKGSTVLTQREYLENAKFGVIVTGPKRQLESMADALDNPCWGIWLGRKACIPATPVNQGSFKTREEAISRLSKAADMPVNRIIQECSPFEAGDLTINDIPLDFTGRKFAPRNINL